MKITVINTRGYERVVHGVDPKTGLNAFIAVHSTVLGPALGGLRLWDYPDEHAALEDVLRLAQGMTFKSAIAGTGLGGGKAVIIGDAKTIKTPELFRAMGDLVNSLEGLYITAEDVNIGIADLVHVAETTRFVTGLSREAGGSGNPSPYTARGVYLGIRASLKHVFGDDSPSGRSVAIQGVGSVARGVVEALLKDGAKVIATDIDQQKIEKFSARHPEIEWVDPSAIYDQKVDVFSPHALGAVVNEDTLPRLQCKIIAGAANNQLQHVRLGAELRQRGILYAPDFVINAGGIINVGCELMEGGYDEKTAMSQIDNIPQALHRIFAEADRSSASTNETAINVAREILRNGNREATQS